ncbi:hypothetical protein FI667_g15404, partial [Globisporangium splendens]
MVEAKQKAALDAPASKHIGILRIERIRAQQLAQLLLDLNDLSARIKSSIIIAASIPYKPTTQQQQQYTHRYNRRGSVAIMPQSRLQTV